MVAALLGAEEYNFGSAALISEGCVMARQCHKNTCPTGVATQREDLRAKFTGQVEHVVNFFTFVAQDIREILASMGLSSLDEAIGRTDLLRPKVLPVGHRGRTLELSAILASADPGEGPLIHTQPRNDWEGDEPLDLLILRDAKSAIEGKGPIKIFYPIRNVHRAVGTQTSSMIARRYGDTGLPSGTIQATFRGSAGQSFGAFLINGMRLILIGEANDYVGKGMAGGEIILRPSDAATFKWSESVILGNTVMYGATGGSLFAAGKAGERFCIRNSGARAVVEGVGDHGCEYMTRGMVVVLGKTGRNFGAGMTGGTAFVYDDKEHLTHQVNHELVLIDPVTAPADIIVLQTLIRQHAEYTQSPLAKEILDKWDHSLKRFCKIHSREAAAKMEAVIAKNE